MKLPVWHGRWEGKALMEPEELDDLITSHAEELTEEQLDTITKVSKEEEEAGSDEGEEVLRSNPTVKFLGEVLGNVRSGHEALPKVHEGDV